LSIAPLQGRPGRLLLVRQTPKQDLPRFRGADLKAAPLSSRARRLRRRNRSKGTLVVLTVLMIMAAVVWVMSLLHR
jgi:hypothetical protein